MPKRGTLIAKPTDELREAFIRNDLEAHCGDRNIEAWLSAQRRASHPDPDAWGRAWLRTPERVHRSCAVIRTYGTALRTPPPAEERQRVLPHGHSSDLRVLRAALSPTFAEQGVYYGYRMGCALLRAGAHARGEPVALVFEWHDPGLTVRPVLMRIPMGSSDRTDNHWRWKRDRHAFANVARDIAFAEWIYHRPKWIRARAFLCEEAARAIARIRKDAEHAFTQCVAVSQRGDESWKAALVVILDNERSRVLRVLPASSFRTRKITLSGAKDVSRERLYGGQRTIAPPARGADWFSAAQSALIVNEPEQRMSAQIAVQMPFMAPGRITREARRIHLEQALVRVGSQTVLFTTERFCPATPSDAPAAAA